MKGDNKMTTNKTFAQKWEEFEQIRSKYKAIGKFISHQSLRLGLK